eukprot:1198898-Pyramimonas_sp.AAC.1
MILLSTADKGLRGGRQEAVAGASPAAMGICLLLATSAPLAVRGAQLAATQSGYPAACPRGPRHDCLDGAHHL